MNKVRVLTKKIEKEERKFDRLTRKHNFKIENLYLELNYWQRFESGEEDYYEPYQDEK